MLLWRWSIGLAIGIFVVVHILAFSPQVLLKINVGSWGRDGQVKTSKVAEIWGIFDTYREHLQLGFI